MINERSKVSIYKSSLALDYYIALAFPICPSLSVIWEPWFSPDIGQKYFAYLMRNGAKNDCDSLEGAYLDPSRTEVTFMMSLSRASSSPDRFPLTPSQMETALI